ncbi:MAG: hypothetical protein RIQ79_1849 [Verrucomicrobiota bacterium]|jgi:hypothetical protein
MNNHDAKFLLQAYRPGGDDSADSQMTLALEQARRDPDLGLWLAREQSFDQQMSAKLQAVTPPSGLRDAILAGGRMSAPARTTQAWWRGAQAQWMGLAAAVALVAVITLSFWPKAKAPGLASLAQTALHEMQGAHGAPTTAEEVGVFGKWLKNPATRLAAGMPVSFEQVRAAGCRSLNVGGREVFEVCFLRNGGEYHFYVGKRQDFNIPGNGSSPMLVAQGGLATLAWADEQHVYVLAGNGDGSALKALL